MVLFVCFYEERERERREEKTDLLVSQRIYIYVNDMKYLNDVVLLFANSRTPNVGFNGSTSPQKRKNNLLRQ